jgi:hypothetical protein
MQSDRTARESRLAIAFALGIGGLAVAAYGLFGLAVVVGDWLPCLSSQATASLNSLPAGYCATIDWVRQFGIGAILTTLGALGIASAVLIVRRHSRSSRDIRGH